VDAEHQDEELILPGLLVSFAYLKHFREARDQYPMRDWVLDSGAFTAWTKGKQVDLSEYIDTALELRAEDPLLTEVFALDVIGDHEGSLRNCEEMHRQGVNAIPCFHVDEPEEALIEMAAKYDKIALGGMVGFKSKRAFAEQCFARVYPKRIHGFGVGAQSDIVSLPWHSVDASNWDIGPNRYGRWNRFGNLSIRGSKSMRSEVDHYLRVERTARQRWGREFASHGWTPPTVRLALAMMFPAAGERIFLTIGRQEAAS